MRHFTGSCRVDVNKALALHKDRHERGDFLRKASRAICINHAMTCRENLQIRNMSRSVAGTAESPGRNVRAKSSLLFAIHDQRWYATVVSSLQRDAATNAVGISGLLAREDVKPAPDVGKVPRLKQS